MTTAENRLTLVAKYFYRHEIPDEIHIFASFCRHNATIGKRTIKIRPL